MEKIRNGLRTAGSTCGSDPLDDVSINIVESPDTLKRHNNSVPGSGTTDADATLIERPKRVFFSDALFEMSARFPPSWY